MRGDYLEISIINWDKYNPRKDRKAHSWFRFDNNFFRETRKWSSDLKLVFLYLCSLRNENLDKDVFTLDVEMASFMLQISEDKINLNITQLTDRNIILVTSWKPYGIPTNERTNERICPISDENGQVTFDFIEAYKSYPRKIGKSKGLKVCEREIKTAQDYKNLFRAIENYKAELVKNKTTSQYIKHFSTFMTSWRDWLDLNEEPPPPKKIYEFKEFD